MNTEKRKPLELWQEEDAQRLRAIYIERWENARPKKRSQAEFGELFNLGSQATVGNLLNGRRALNIDNAAKFALGLKCAVADFSPTLAERITQHAKANDHGHNNVIPAPGIRGKVPVISWVQAGNWMEIIDNFAVGDAEEWVKTTYQSRDHTFALRVQGDSMEPKFPEGCILIVEPDDDAIHGKYIIAKRPSDNTATFKQLIIDGGIAYLKPLNNKYPLLEFTAGTIIVGVVKRMEMDV